MNRDQKLEKLRSLFGVVAEDLAEEDPMREVGRVVGQQVTNLVAYLALTFPNEHVNQLMWQVWDLVGSCTTPVAIGPVETPSSAVLKQDDQVQMIILIPPDWLTNGMKDHTMVVGAMVFCGSQAVDHYNDKLLSNPQISADRARAFEVEALRVFRDTDPTWVPNEYQKDILRQFPDGIATEGVVLYDPKPTPHTPPPVLVAES